jgi:hypothetical protein
VARLAHAPLLHRLGRTDAACLALGVASLAWLIPALWPNARWPAWPSVSLGAMALLLACRPGRAGLRGLASIAGFTGVVLGSVQIAVLWGSALITP